MNKKTELPSWLSEDYRAFFAPAESAPIKFLRLPAVCEMTGLSRTQVYRLEQDGKFPTRVKLSVSTSAWVHAEVQLWCKQRIEAARAK